MTFIKWTYGFNHSPHVFRVSRILGLDQRVVACCMMEFWQWFDCEARSYIVKLRGITTAQIDECLSLPAGFTDAMIEAELLDRGRDTLTAVNRSWSGSGQRERKRESFVYFIRNTETLNIKIGFSCHPKQRCADLATSGDLKLLGYFAGNQSTEKQLHSRFAKSRVHREWFFPTPDLIDFIRSKGFEA